jgi:transposase
MTIRGCGVARPKPWHVEDELWAVIEPLLPKVERRTRFPGRKRHPDRIVFQGILIVLHTGIALGTPSAGARFRLGA